VSRTPWRFEWVLGAMLLAGLGLRLAYVAVQGSTDPWFAFPVSDGADVLAWAHELARGESLRPGAFYTPPLYPYLLALFLRIFGENFGLLYYVQHLGVVASAGLLALVGRRLLGDVAGLATCALLLLYGPVLFFASRPFGEPLALLFLCAALVAWTGRPRGWTAAVAGLLCGVAAIGRPNLGLVAPLLAGGSVRPGVRRGWILLGAFVLALVPTTVRNHRASGHVVPVSANAGLTLYHGKSGLDLDPVEADRWWGRQAVGTRLGDLPGSIRLLGRRLLLLVSNVELSLDAGPRQDANPMRRVAPVPFCLLLGLAVAGLVAGGWKGTGGWSAWGPVLACAAAPLLFYVSSRYRLPMAYMLCLPAGGGLAALVGSSGAVGRRRRVSAAIAGLLVVAVSLGVPTRAVRAQADAGGYKLRGLAWNRAGRFGAAEADFRRALELNPGRAQIHFFLGGLFEQTGRPAEAEAAYRLALRLQPTYADPSCYLGQMLGSAGRHEEALVYLLGGLEFDPYHKVCWNHGIHVRMLLGQLDEAASDLKRAKGLGVELDSRLRPRLDGLMAEREAQGGSDE
jgi:Flp pilus assembly protein TadD